MDPTSEVLDAVRRRADALVARNADALSALLHQDFRWTSHKAEVFDHTRYVEGNTAGPLRWLGQRLEDAEVLLVGDTAVVVAEVVDDVERGGTRDQFRLRLTQTWVRVDAEWLCLAGHAGPPVERAAS